MLTCRLEYKYNCKLRMDLIHHSQTERHQPGSCHKLVRFCESEKKVNAGKNKKQQASVFGETGFGRKNR